MNENFRKLSSLSFFVVLLPLSAVAEEDATTHAGNFFDFSVNSEFGSIDNFLYSESNKKQTSYYMLMPKVSIQTQFDRQLLTLNTSTRHFKYDNFSQDDHSNFSISPRYQYKFSENKTLVIHANYQNLYQERGTGLSLGNAEALSKGDDIHQANYSLGYLYGSENSVAKINLEVGRATQRFQTRRALTQAFDRSEYYYQLAFDYLLSGKTYIATEVKITSTTHDNNDEQNKDKYVALAGVKWQTTEISQFTGLVGYQKVTFNKSQFADDDAFKWRLDWFWHPIDSTRIVIASERDFEEAIRQSNSYRVVDSYQVNATTRFTDYTQVTASIGFNREDTIFQDKVENEDYTFVKLNLNYQRNDWLSLFIKYTYNDLDATETQLNHQRNSISLGFNVSI